MIQYQKRKEVKGGSMQLLVVGFLSLYFSTFAQGMDDRNGKEQNVSRSSVEVPNDVPEDKCLMGLSDDLLLKIFSCFSPRNLVNISETNHRIHTLSYDNDLWEKHKVLFPESQRTADSGRSIFKDLCQNPIVFQFYNNSNLTVNFAFGYQYIWNASVREDMSNIVSLPHNGLLTIRKNNFPEDRKNSIQSSHCAYMPIIPNSPLVRTNYKQELPVGFCLDILQEREFGFVMLAFNTISSLR